MREGVQEGGSTGGRDYWREGAYRRRGVQEGGSPCGRHAARNTSSTMPRRRRSHAVRGGTARVSTRQRAAPACPRCHAKTTHASAQGRTRALNPATACIYMCRCDHAP